MGVFRTGWVLSFALTGAAAGSPPLGAWMGAGPLAPATDRPVHPARASRDTQLVLDPAASKAAREAQRTFERTRRRNLRFWNGPRGRCDEIVGRFCLWHDSDGSFDPGPEAERIRSARDELIEVLDRAVRAAPGDWWVVGQWVRYLIEAGRLEEARSAAGECAAGRWWCAALSGYALHALGSFASADSAFRVALRQMPADSSCRWRDLSYLLEGDLRDDYEDLDCSDRAALEARVWWLSDPLFMVSGNERRTEHFSRRVLNRLQLGAESPYGVSWGRDLEELLVRYGWPQGWSRRREPLYSASRQRPSITGHEPDVSFHFVTPPELLAEFTAEDVADWELKPRRPREEYLPTYARSFDGRQEGFDYQLAVFQRGSLALLVGAYEWANDSVPQDTPIRAALVHGSEMTVPTVTVSQDAPRRGVLTSRARPGPSVLGIEVLADSAGRAARVRIGRRIPASSGEPAISDILLLEPPAAEALPGTLEEALHLARPSTTVRSGERVAVLWELYEVAEGTPLEVEVSLTKPEKSFFRRAAEWLGLAKKNAPTVSLGWRENSAGGPGPVARYLELRIPELSEGRYVLTASVQLAGVAELTSARVLRVSDR